MKYYAVARGRNRGIYDNWIQTKEEVHGYFAAKYKGFNTMEEAEEFLKSYPVEEPGVIKFFDRKIDDTAPLIKEPTDNKLVCFTDGSALHNGKHNAKAGYAVVWPFYPNHDVSISLNDKPTNNRAEYSALISALQIADQIDPTRLELLIVHTDSMLLINSITKWLPAWKRNNFKKKDGTPVMNVDLLNAIEELMKKRNTQLKHVRAHTGGSDWASIYNDKVDKLAKKASHNAP